MNDLIANDRVIQDMLRIDRLHKRTFWQRVWEWLA